VETDDEDLAGSGGGEVYLFAFQSRFSYTHGFKACSCICATKKAIKHIKSEKQQNLRSVRTYFENSFPKEKSCKSICFTFAVLITFKHL